MNVLKISVVIPIFNTERYLRECVDSLIAQTIFGDMELILVDDGSSDGSPAICDAYAEKYNNIKAIHKENAGVSAARNAGIDVADGDYIGFVDSDDKVYPDMFQLLHDAAEKTDADMAFCGIEHPRPDKNVIIEYPFDNGVLLGKEYIKNSVAPYMLAEASFNSLCNKLLKRRVIEENGLRLSVGKRYGEDRELVIRFLLVCGGICGIPYTGYFYRYVPSSAVNKPRADYTDTIFEQYALDRALFLKLGVEPELFDKLTAVSVAEQLIGAMVIAEEQLKGAERKKVILGMMKNDSTQKLISENYDFLISQSSRFDALLIRMTKQKSVEGLRAIVSLMRIRVKLYHFFKRGAADKTTVLS